MNIKQIANSNETWVDIMGEPHLLLSEYLFVKRLKSHLLGLVACDVERV